MKKLSFVILVTIATLVVSSCQPPKQGGEEAAPSKSFNGEVEQPSLQKPDSSIEKSVESKNLKDSVLEGKK